MTPAVVQGYSCRYRRVRRKFECVPGAVINLATALRENIEANMVVGEHRTCASTGTAEIVDDTKCRSFANLPGGKCGCIDCAGREQ